MMPTITPPSTPADLALRLLAAIVSGAIIGLNRELAGKPAGLRTHALVALGAAAGCAVGLSIPGDPSATSRVLQGIMAGVGFIGGGVILHDRRGGVHGLTTAASIWVVAAAGMAAGTGLFVATGRSWRLRSSCWCWAKSLTARCTGGAGIGRPTTSTTDASENSAPAR
jgi:putative Mg2+ transporter-C (MgtC) family protein